MTYNRKTELLPCPFCGGEAHISDDYSSKRGMVYSVWHDCPAGGGYHPYGQGVGVLQVTSAWFSSREEAIAAWNTRTAHGTLTAEQVRETVEKHWHDLSADYDMPEATALPEYSYDWQAIADELNAELGSGTCEFTVEYDRDEVERRRKMYEENPFGLFPQDMPQSAWTCSNCGQQLKCHYNRLTGELLPVPSWIKHCPNCGKAVKC